ncbi:MAG TPA: PadR family transcriptional regulator [Acidimicrobiales bacterium]|jgi:DNA-binding PadR family transcriptional regulator
MSTSGHIVNPTAGSLLGFLATFGPMTGWDLDRAVSDSIGEFWNVTRSQIYRELQDLEARGLVESGQPGPRDSIPYEITADGRAALLDWLAREPGSDVIRHRLLLTVFFSDHLPEDRLAEILDSQRKTHQEILERYQGLQGGLGLEGAMAATLRFGIAYEQMLLEWLSTLPYAEKSPL